MKIYNGKNEKLKRYFSIIGIFLLGGLILDATCGFHILRHSTKIIITILGILCVGVFWIVCSIIAEKIGSKDEKDKASSNLFGRFINVVALVSFLVIMYIGLTIIYKIFGWE